MINLLLIGPLPPPVGGVTIHVRRLYENLKVDENFKVEIINKNNVSTLKYMYRYDTVHVHVNNPYKRLFIIFLFYFSNIKIVLTFHRDIDRNGGLKKKIDDLAIKLVDLPLMLNEKSYFYAKELNEESKLISSFIEPIYEEKLSSSVLKIIRKAKKFENVFATNAHHYRLDKKGKEIYGIFELIELFRSIYINSLIISDPSGEYNELIVKKNIDLPTNVFILTEPHSFFNLLKKIDGLIRNTTTDGDSLSIREALYLNKVVFCTDVVDRPANTVTYPLHDKKILMNHLSKSNFSQSKTTVNNSFVNYLKLLKKLNGTN